MSQKLKDDLAYLITSEDWKDVCKKFLPEEIERVRDDNNTVYDQAYNVVCLLIERGIVSTWSDMKKKVLNNVDRAIIKKFEEKSKKTALARG